VERSGAVGRVELSILWKKIQIRTGLCPRAQQSNQKGRAAGELRPERSREEGER
jgi:hypothetical protein